MQLLEELKWRGLLQDFTPGLENLLKGSKVKGYAGFDPTADSLHIGNLVPVMLLTHFQRAGHQPVVLMGGATGMIGDPSGKSEERKLLSTEEIKHNLNCQQKQLSRFLDFNGNGNKALIVNNADWFRNYKFLDFLREVGKHITISYMMTKDSVKSRLESGISFAEFTYQLIQGYDFYWLCENMNVSVQMGGSDQWGNMLTGTELIRRKAEKEAHAFTAPLITKSDGSKFGKSEGGNIWLDPVRTSPYKFYQYWLNTSDENAMRYIRVFSLMDKKEIEGIVNDHAVEPHKRKIQNTLAEELTKRIHSAEELKNAVSASRILFGNSTRENLLELSDSQLIEVFGDVPQKTIVAGDISNGMDIVDFLSGITEIIPSRGEARRMLQANSISINKEKVGEDHRVTSGDVLRDRYILVQKGKKNYFLVTLTN